MQNKKSSNRQVSDYTPFIWAVVIGFVCFAAHIFICKSVEGADPAWVGLALLVIYIISVTVLAVSVFRYQKNKYSAEEKLSENGNAIRDLLAQVNTPLMLTDGNGKLLWYNGSAANVFGLGDVSVGKSMYGICEYTEEKLLSGTQSGGVPIIYSSEEYNVNCYSIRTPGKNLNDIRDLYLISFDDITDLNQARRTIDRTLPVFAYIMVDNLEELTQYVKVSYRQATGEIEALLKEWAIGLGGVLREYDRDRYILVFSREKLTECTEDKFSILDRIREIRLSDEDISLPVTVSMGVATAPLGSNGFDLAAIEHDAANALDIALQRGGDQVAVKTENGLEYFGGRTKSVQKRTRVRARVIAETLCTHISSSSRVLIMGHKNPDFDSIGACIGLARLSMYCGVECKIVIDTDHVNFRIATERLVGSEEYEHLFIDGAHALELIEPSTLVILTDANNFKIIQTPELAQNAKTVYIIDHHRQTDEMPDTVVNPPYIDPAASSACELVAEILEQCVPTGTLQKEEASIMLAGIMVDTSNFTRTTSTRTFAAALYLRGEGANTEVASGFFDEELNDYIAEAKFGNDVVIYKKRIAITKSDGTNTAFDRIAAAKAASKLRSVRGIDASFALVDLGNGINISARSNGSINVQLVLEKLNGGGHFDAAGAQISGVTLEEAAIKLKAAIDEYIEETKE